MSNNTEVIGSNINDTPSAAKAPELNNVNPEPQVFSQTDGDITDRNVNEKPQKKEKLESIGVVNMHADRIATSDLGSVNSQPEQKIKLNNIGNVNK